MKKPIKFYTIFMFMHDTCGYLSSTIKSPTNTWHHMHLCGEKELSHKGEDLKPYLLSRVEGLVLELYDHLVMTLLRKRKALDLEEVITTLMQEYH